MYYLHLLSNGDKEILADIRAEVKALKPALDAKKKEVRAQKKIFERLEKLLTRQKQKVIEGKPRTMTETANTFDWAFSKL